MGTGIVSSLCTNFPYGNGSAGLQWLGFAFFMLNLILFIFVCTCTIARYVMFPEVSFPANTIGIADKKFRFGGSC